LVNHALIWTLTFFEEYTWTSVFVYVCIAVVVFDLVISIHFTNILIQKYWIIKIFWGGKCF